MRRLVFLLVGLLALSLIACNSSTATSEVATMPPTSMPTPVPTNTPVPVTDTPPPLLASTAPVEGYVVLTNAMPGDPYYDAALLLGEYRDAGVITFSSVLNTTLDALRAAEPRFVALVIRPETMDEDLAWEMFQLAKNMDDDYDTDFAYGFITGVTAEDVQQYVQSVAAYEAGLINPAGRARVVWRTGEGAISGGAGGVADADTQAAADLFAGMGLDAARIDSEELTTEEVWAEISPSDVLVFTLHASPTYFETRRGEGITGADISELERGLFIIHTGCYAGAVHKWYNQGASAPLEYSGRVMFTEPADSLALSFLRHGTLAYVGHLCMWGPGNWPLTLIQALADDPSLTMGEMMMAHYNRPSGPSIIEESAASDIIGMDNNRFYYAAMVLYGDPALRIFQP